jgi:hypothetical protein
MASRAWPHEPTTSTFALVTALRSLTAVVIVADKPEAEESAAAYTRLTAPSPHLTPPKGSARQVSSDPPVKLPGVN